MLRTFVEMSSSTISPRALRAEKVMSKKSAYIKGIAVVVGVLILAGLVYWFWPKKALPPQGFGFGTPAVTVVHPTRELVALDDTIPGRTVSHQVAEIRPQVSGIIIDRPFTEGSDVKKSQQLYQIDPAPFEAARDSAEADVARAQADITALQAKADRFAGLVEIDAVSKQDYADITAALAQANADLAVANAAFTTAKLNLEYTKVLAPISGRIGKSNVTKGALVTANQSLPIATITQLDPIYVDLLQPNERIAAMRAAVSKDTPLIVTLLMGENNAHYEHKGTLQFADVTVDPSTDSILLRTVFPNPDLALLPGMFVRAKVTLESIDAVLLPQRAVILMPNGSTSVWLIDENNKASLKTVTTLKTHNGQWIIIDGVTEKDTVVLEGYQRLMPGATVAPSFPEAPKNTPESPESGEKH